MSEKSSDILFRNARIIDGSGSPSVKGDVAVRCDRISAWGDLSLTTGGVEIDAGGLALAPGFIDVHTHDDRAVLADPEMVCKVSQGVTTVVTGNCGISLAPLTLHGAPPPPLDLSPFKFSLLRKPTVSAAAAKLAQFGSSTKLSRDSAPSKRPVKFSAAKRSPA